MPDRILPCLNVQYIDNVDPTRWCLIVSSDASGGASPPITRNFKCICGCVHSCIFATSKTVGKLRFGNEVALLGN